ncbi:MAG: hypothetical protein JWO69_939 [Thermoleophilia bacterium]|nr:hypothetical protein [Thermoleophilia bacterium]
MGIPTTSTDVAGGRMMTTHDTGSRGTSDEAVREATGRDWESWFHWLDAHDAGDLDHPSIVKLLEERAELPNGWWQQQVTVNFEQHIGRRVPGMTADGTFQVGARRTFRSSPSRVWNRIASPEGAAAWLGETPNEWWHGTFEGGPERGDVLDAPSREQFEVRSYASGSRIRLRVLGPHLPEGSTIQLSVTGEGGRAVVGLHHEGIPDEQVRVQMREHWKRALDRIEALLDEDLS